MAHPQGSAGAVPWGRRALGVGLAVSVQVPIIILLSQLANALHLAYPFVILPLLLAGPIAVQRQTGRSAIAAAALAGAISAILTSTSLALGMRLTGFAQWGLASAASA